MQRLRQHLLTAILTLLSLNVVLGVWAILIKTPEIDKVENLKTVKVDKLINLDKHSALSITLVEKDGDKFYVPENLDTSDATVSAQAVRVTFKKSLIGLTHPPREFILVEYTLKAEPWIRKELGYCPCEAEVYDRDEVLQRRVRDVLQVPHTVMIEE